MGDLPQVAIDLLPLSAEAMSQWKQEVDIRQFARALYPPPFYPPSIAELEDELVKEMREQARAFTKNLMEAYNATTYLAHSNKRSESCFCQVNREPFYELSLDTHTYALFP